MLKKIKYFGLKRLLIFLYILMYLKVKYFLYLKLFSDNHAKGSAKIIQPTQFVGRGDIYIGRSQIGVWPSPSLISESSYFEARACTAKISIGNETIINNGAILIADRSEIKIGDRCLIGPKFFVIDSDFHGLDIKSRNNGNYECHPVCIGNDVFVGYDVKIMKGVVIGNGAVIASGSVVTKNVMPNTIVAGSPAKRIGSIVRS